MSILINNNTIKNIYIKQNQLQEITKGYIKSNGNLKLFYDKQNENQGLPKEYEQVEYIYNNKGAYINTEITGCYTYECKFKYVNSSSDYSIPFGLRYSDYTKSINYGYEIIVFNDRIYTYHLSESTTLNYINTKQNINILYNIIPNHTVEIYNMNNEKIFSNKYVNESEIDYFNNIELALFARTSYNAPYDEYNFIAGPGGIEMYNFKIYSSPSRNQIIADFIPCKRKADNKAGMYNLIGRTFHTNTGSEQYGGLLAEGDPNIPS